MSVTLTITNTTSVAVQLTELYSEVGPVGSATQSITATRSVAELDKMIALKKLLSAGTVTVDLVASTDNAGILSIAASQHGVAAALDVSSVAVVTQAVTFPEPFDAAVVPNMELTMLQNTVTGYKANAYVRSLTHTGFTVALDVTTAVSGAVTNEAPAWSPTPNGTLLGPFTATLAQPPLTAAAITLNWKESTVAKTATLTSPSTVGGTNAANISAASLNITSGAISVTFAGGHPPDAGGTFTVSYVHSQVHTADVHWTAKS